MSSFDLHLLSSTQYENIQDVESFVAEDETGSFGILAGHLRFMTVLSFGIARFRCRNSEWEYLAIPGGLTYFYENTLFVNTRHYIRSSDYLAISDILQKQLLSEEESLKELKHTLHHMDEAMLKRMWELRRLGGVTK